MCGNIPIHIAHIRNAMVILSTAVQPNENYILYSYIFMHNCSIQKTTKSILSIFRENHKWHVYIMIE